MQLAERPTARDGEKRPSAVEGPGLHAHECGIEGALSPPCRIRGQLCGAMQEGGRGRYTAAGLRPACRMLELSCHLLARTRRGSGAMPGSPVGVRLGVCDISEGAVHPLAVLVGGCSVSSRSDQRVRELDAHPDPEETCFYGRARCRCVEAEHLGSTIEEKAIPERLGGGGEDEQPCLGGQLKEAVGEASLDLAGDRLALGKAEAARQLCGVVPGSGELEQRERVAVALGHDLVTDVYIQRAVHVSKQQRAGIAVPESVDGQLRQPSENLVAAARARRADERDPLCKEAARHEAEDLS